jgi:peptidoglycan/xylan/chitin deacetylase (PgdA/CDA1 family)
MHGVGIFFVGGLLALALPFAAHAAENLVQNPGLETAGISGSPANWTKTFWGTPTPTFAYPVAGRTGNGASITFSANSSGDARWQHAPVAVTAGTQYTFSIWYKSTAATEINMEFSNATGGSISYGWLANLPSSSGVWTQYTGSFTVPTGKARVAVFQLLDKTGSLTIDDVSLTVGAGTPPPPSPPGTPTVSLSANPTSITSGQSSTLTWSSTNATSCTASGAWSGARELSGSVSVSPTATATYTLACTGAGGTTSQSTTVTVSTQPPPPTGGFAEGMVSFSFDDSWASQYTNALPILQTAGLKGTFYLTTEPIQEAWDEFMTPNQVKDIGRKGHEIAGHTITHVDLTTVGQTRINREIKNSKTYLQTLIGQTVVSFAYPYGALSNTTKNLLKQAGYTSARGVDYEALNTATTDKYDLKSLCIETSNPISEIKAEIDKAKANKQWFILCIHEVKNGGDQYTMTPAKLQEIVDYVKSTGIKAVTVKEGRALMSN